MSRRSGSRLNNQLEDNFWNEYRIRPATSWIDKVTPVFDADYNDLDMEYSIDEKPVIENVDAECSKSWTVNQTKCSQNLSTLNTNQVSNCEMMQFMKSQIQEVRDEFMGALNELISINKRIKITDTEESKTKLIECDTTSKLNNTNDLTYYKSAKPSDKSLVINWDFINNDNENDSKKISDFKSININKSSSASVIQTNNNVLNNNHIKLKENK